MTAAGNGSSGGHDVVVFPGQGSQRVGMGADFHERYEVARRTFEEASDAAGEDLAAICFEQDRRLHLTEFTQPCILTMEIAAYRVAVEEHGLAARRFGGHSLGEYAALTAAGALGLADAVRLVRTRGALMQRAVPSGRGGMAALLLDDIESSAAASIARRAGASVANHNSPAQLVISGLAESLDAASQALAAALPDLTFVPLKVSAPFHCELMGPVAAQLRAHLEAASFRSELAAAVTSNHTGAFHDPQALVENLAQQVLAPVRWLDNMRELADGAARIYEIGPSVALSKFFGALGHEASPIKSVDDAQRVLRGHEPPATPRRAARLARDTLGDDAGRSRTRPSPAAQSLGDPEFRRDHGVELAYVAGGMRMGIASAAFVVRLGRARLLGYLGGAGVRLDRLEPDIQRVAAALPPGAPWGVNLTRDPYDPGIDGRAVDLLLAREVPRVEVSGYDAPTPELVRYRLSGLRRDASGQARPAHRLLAKVSRVESARRFLAPAPETIVRLLRDRREISEDEARLAGLVAVADDVCAEAGCDGQDSSALAFSLLPALARVRDEMLADKTSPQRVRIGAAGGIGTPEAAAAVLTMGADFVLTGSINQCTVEADTSDLVKDMLAGADIEDFATAPSSDLFELGGRTPVLRRGVLFAARASRLYELYVRYGSIEELAPEERARIEEQYLRRSFDDVWAGVQADLAGTGQGQLERARDDARMRMALILRWYLADTCRRAREGDAHDRVNLQIRSGPALGAFNRAVAGTPLQDWRKRHVDEIAVHVMDGAARLLDERRRGGSPAIAAGQAR